MAEQARPRDIAKGFGAARHRWWSLLGRARLIDVWHPPPAPAPPPPPRGAPGPPLLCSLGACLRRPSAPPPPPPAPRLPPAAAGADAAAAAALGRRRAALLAKVPDCPGVYVWLVRPPRARDAGLRGGGGGPWSPVYLGKSDRLRQRLSCYLRPDGGFGPADEPHKLRAMLDLMRRGFCVQVRFRPAKVCEAAGGARQDERAKLALWDFCLNASENGGRRPLELPSGRQAGDYPVVDARAARLHDALAAREGPPPPGAGAGTGAEAGAGNAGGRRRAGGAAAAAAVPLAVVRAAAVAGGKAAVAATAAGGGGGVPVVVATAGRRA